MITRSGRLQKQVTKK
ncbi:hypothetical protein B4U80_06287 [Leptotrombidium deliense]|uniref:Uncharacterized protein n=1 Tax=Leptotrombidium deliense TaxID=299467 RepID=A0A443RVA7_9ACAR|nr:hypothetical protein B4U80_06287 [Leptotrombidium deliense]